MTLYKFTVRYTSSNTISISHDIEAAEVDIKDYPEIVPDKICPCISGNDKTLIIYVCTSLDKINYFKSGMTEALELQEARNV